MTSHESLTLTTDAPGQVYVLRHQSHSLGVDSAQVGIFKQASHIGLCCLLNGQDCLALESSFRVVASGDLTKDPLERMLGQNQIGAFLVLSDLSQS